MLDYSIANKIYPEVEVEIIPATYNLNMIYYK